MTTLNTIIEEEKKEFDKDFVTKDGFVGTGITNPQDIKNFLTTAMQRVAKAERADWLRSEIEKLEGIVEILTKEHYGISYVSDTCIECSNHTRIAETVTALTSIITRYKEELKELEGK